MRSIIKNEVELEEGFNIFGLYNWRRGCDPFYSNLLQELSKVEILKIIKYHIEDYATVQREKQELDNKEFYQMYGKFEKYSRENKSCVMNLYYVYKKIKCDDLELKKEIYAPLEINGSVSIEASLFSKRHRFIITNTDENADDFFKLCLLKDFELYIVTTDIRGGMEVYLIQKSDNFLETVEPIIVDYKRECSQKSDEALKKAFSWLTESKFD